MGEQDLLLKSKIGKERGTLDGQGFWEGPDARYRVRHFESLLRLALQKALASRPAHVWRGGRKIRAKPVMSHLAYYVIDEPRRIVFIIDVAAGAQGPKRDKYEGNA